MILYYLQIPYVNSKQRVVAAVYNVDAFKFDTSTLSPFATLIIDEVDPANKALCLDLVRSVNKINQEGKPKYYIDPTGVLMLTSGWVEYTDII